MPDDSATDHVQPVERRIKQVLFKVTLAEKLSYVAAAKRSKVDLSKWIRSQLDAASHAPE